MRWRFKIKRLIDILVSLLLLILLFPLMIIISLLTLISLGSPILFVHERAGLNTVLFKLYKFRTMTNTKNYDDDLMSDKNRLIPFGLFLRKASLDELPSLWNVLKGDMSLVGPRPLLVEYLPLYSKEQMRRHEVKPGITGWAQINGRNLISWEEKFNLDIWYVDNQSFLIDIKIIIITIWKILRQEGISQVDHVTMRKFEGN